MKPNFYLDLAVPWDILIASLSFVDLLVCTEHPENLCSCPMSEKVLRYRYTLEELPAMISQLKKRAESYDQWSQSVNEAMNFKDGRNKLGKC